MQAKKIDKKIHARQKFQNKYSNNGGKDPYTTRGQKKNCARHKLPSSLPLVF